MSGQQDEGLSDLFSAPPEEVAAAYDEWAEGYDVDVESWGYRVPQVIAAMVANANPPAGPVLDAGCGTGRSGQALVDAGLTEVVGVDFSAESLRLANERGIYQFTAQVDLTKPLPFPDDSFGAAISCGVFSYFSDVLAVFRELLRVTRSGGSVVISQRTDLWESQGFPSAMETLRASGECRAAWSEPQPYLPGHAEFGSDIQVIYIQLVVA